MFIEDFLTKFAIIMILVSILLFLTKNLKTFILVYIASRSFIAIFYDINVIGGINILELVGFFFPAILLIYWVVNRRGELSEVHLTKFYLIIVAWVLFSTFVSIYNFGFMGIASFSPLMRIFNGLSVFIVFPLIFKTEKDIKSLMKAIFIMTLFPLIQGLVQILIGADIFGMYTNVMRGDRADFTMYYGLYHKYGWYANASLFGGLFLIYKSGSNGKKIISKPHIQYIMFILYLILASTTLSRTLFISMLIILIFLFINQKKKNKIILMLFFLLFIGGGFFQEQLNQITRRSESEVAVIKGEIPIEYGFHGRVSRWKYKLIEFNNHSFLERVIGTNLGIGPHSDYVQWVLSYGYVGLSLYVLFLLILFIKIFHLVIELKKKAIPYLNAYGCMVLAGLVVWVIEGVIHNPSFMLDYSYVIMGNIAIFASIGKRVLTESKNSHL